MEIVQQMLGPAPNLHVHMILWCRCIKLTVDGLHDPASVSGSGNFPSAAASRPNLVLLSGVEGGYFLGIKLPEREADYWHVYSSAENKNACSFTSTPSLLLHTCGYELAVGLCWWC